MRDVHVIGGVVHCDLSLGNMYFLPDGKVRTSTSPDSLRLQMLVNDFGSAVRVGAKARKGNPYFMPKSVHDCQEHEYVAQPAHDLETFVKVIMYGADARVANFLEQKAPDQAAAWWSAREEIDPTLRELLVHARACNYDELKKLLVVLACNAQKLLNAAHFI